MCVNSNDKNHMIGNITIIFWCYAKCLNTALFSLYYSMRAVLLFRFYR